MEPLVSVVIPVYKTEKYVVKSVNSILTQSYKNTEIIIVDDGSPDSCPKICDDLQKSDNRIIVIHKENGGLSSARNTGSMRQTVNMFSFWIRTIPFTPML